MDLYRLNKRKPIFIGLILFIFCSILRIVEVLIYQLVENDAYSIYANLITLIIILLFFHYTKSNTRDIGLSSRRLTESLPLGTMLVFLPLFLSYGSQFLFLQQNHASPRFILNDYTWIQFIVYVLIGHAIAAFIEEGLFRGILLRGFMRNWSFLFSNSLQAFLFGLWHMSWLIKKYTIGQISLNSIFFFFVMTGIIGFLIGYIYYLTSNLWVSIFWHMIWYLCTDMVTIQSFISANNSGLMLFSANIFWCAFLFSSILLILILYIRKTMKERLFVNL